MIKNSVRKINDYYVYYSLDVAFKFIGKDEVIVVDSITGQPKSRVQQKDANGVFIEVDDPDGFQPVF